MASGVEDYLRRVIAAESPLPGPGPAMLRGLLGGLSLIYDAALEGYLAAERMGLRRRERLPVPVLSIGNLTVGGTGKTPMTQLVCRRLAAAGKRVGVLSRGHGGEGVQVRVVSDPGGALLMTPSEAGDEPVLLARSLPGIPVLTGKDRRVSGREALRSFGLDVLVLDDGFQYWQLARDCDLILLDSRLPFDNGRPLPRGLLREPARHLKRASLAVFTRAGGCDAAARKRLAAQVEALAPGMDVFFADHRPIGLAAIDDPAAALVPLESLRGRRVLALSGIAQPAAFRQSLAVAGMDVVEHLAWDDHHPPTQADVDAVYKKAETLCAEAVVMTEKDAVKWPEGGGAPCPVHALRIEMAVGDEERFLGAIAARLFDKIKSV
jgi:tetraacyldisaccharide 4'-kinase